MTVVLVLFLISLVSDSPEELLSDAYVPKWSLQQQHYQGSIQFPLILQCLQERNTHQSHIKLLSVQSVPPVVQFIIWKIKLLQHHIFFWDLLWKVWMCVSLLTWTSCGKYTSSSPSGICSKYWTAVCRTVWSWKLEVRSVGKGSDHFCFKWMKR